MRRALTVLKYFPAALCVLLLIAWINSFLILPMVTVPAGNGDAAIYLENATLNVFYRSEMGLSPTPLEGKWGFEIHEPNKEHQWTKLLGVFLWHNVDLSAGAIYSRLLLPIPMLLLLVLPFAIASLSRFRLPLWSWFAWTALLAGGLTFYLNTSRPS